MKETIKPPSYPEFSIESVAVRLLGAIYMVPIRFKPVINWLILPPSSAGVYRNGVDPKLARTCAFVDPSPSVGYNLHGENSISGSVCTKD